MNKYQAENDDKYIVFAVAFGLFAIYHFAVYLFQFRVGFYLSSWVIPLLGLLLIMRPYWKSAFLLLVVTMAIDGWLQAPVTSNHTIIKNFFVAGILAAGIYRLAIGDKSWQNFFNDFAFLGRALLIVMYIYGIFHKINTDFLNPEISCAVELLYKMPLPAEVAGWLSVRYMAIYGALIVEGVIIFLLLSRRFRYYGILSGMVFHALLATSAYAFYPTFSMLSIALHTLFLPARTLLNFKQTSAGEWFFDPANNWKIYTYLIAWLVIQFAAGLHAGYGAAVLPWLMLIAPFFVFVILGYDHNSLPEPPSKLLKPGSWPVALIAALFIFNGLTPFLGLKTRQSINMFANLHLEDGRSNHLVFNKAPGPFGYLEDIVFLRKVSGDADLQTYHRDGYGVVYYELLNILEKHRRVTVSYLRDGTLYEDVNYASLEQEAKRYLHPRWFRKWFHFAPVSMEQPKRCSLIN